MAAVVIAAHTLTRERAPVFAAGPSASSITVTAHTPTGFPLTDAELTAALAAPAVLGPLADPERRASCLVGLGYAPDIDVLGGRPVTESGRPVVLMLLPAAAADEVAAVAVEPSCDAAHTGLLAETTLIRP